MNQVARCMLTWCSDSMMKISSFLLNEGAFLAKLLRGFVPARSLNQASNALFVRAVTGQKLSFVLICCFFFALSLSVSSSSFRARMALKYAPTLLAVTLQFLAELNSSDSCRVLANPCFTFNEVNSSSRCFGSCG